MSFSISTKSNYFDLSNQDKSILFFTSGMKGGIISFAFFQSMFLKNGCCLTSSAPFTPSHYAGFGFKNFFIKSIISGLIYMRISSGGHQIQWALIFSKTSSFDFALNGKLPVTNSKAITPTAHQSTVSSVSLVHLTFNTSGAM